MRYPFNKTLLASLKISSIKRMDGNRITDVLIINDQGDILKSIENKPEKVETAYMATMCGVYQEPNSFVRYDSKIYVLNTILQITDTFPVGMFPVRELSWLLDDHCLSSERVQKADMSYPIIITTFRNKFTVLDGVHRLGKAIIGGITDILIKFIHPDLFRGFALQPDHQIYTYEAEQDDVKDLQIVLKNK